MRLRNLSLENYGIFEDASFDLTTRDGAPVVLITGNNGAGKTSLLEALRLALHGRRGFDTPLGEAEYMRTMTGRFHLGDYSRQCSITLEFDYVDLHRTRIIAVKRSWTMRRQNVAEELCVTIDGNALILEDAEDLLASIVPPEVARYFFFDGERIRELAEWDVDDESALFSAVADLLGLGVLDQLRLDLLRLTTDAGKGKRRAGDAAAALFDAQKEAQTVNADLTVARKLERKLRMNFDRARENVRRVGALAQDEFAKLESELAELEAERRMLVEESTRAAGDILPLLCARTLRKRFGKELSTRRLLEDREIVSKFLDDHSTALLSRLGSEGFRPRDARSALAAIAEVAGRPLLPVGAALPPLARNDALWMERVIERELPEIERRNREIVAKLHLVTDRIGFLDGRRLAVPKNDPASEASLTRLEEAQRAFVAHEAVLTQLQKQFIDLTKKLDEAQVNAKSQRLEAFRVGRLRVREQLTQQVLEALPTLAERLQSSKEQRFARHLGDALRSLWNKADRLVNVEVSFSERKIALFDAYGEIRKKDLAAGEKQLFAVAFIHALARLSGRQMPFVIDTPLGRLDRAHRVRFVAKFLPQASHQVVLLSTDTEIVGSLYDELQPFLSRHLELASSNGGATAPVELASA